jgi:hypothetical protein
MSVLPSPTSDTLHCPEGTEQDDASTSDQGWDYPERVIQCLRPDRHAEGPAIEYFGGAQGHGSTKFIGRYAHGVRVGTWTQYDSKTGARLASFTLDAEGNGTEDFRDQVGHRLVGRLNRDERDGPWTYFDTNGNAVATHVYAKGTVVRGTGAVPWDPPMLDPRDKCPTEPEGRDSPTDLDGCPEPKKSQ